VRAPVDMPWPRVASPAQPRPGPPRSTLSFVVALPTRQTRPRVLTPPVAVDQLAIFPRPCRQYSSSLSLSSLSPTSLSSSLAPPRPHLASAYLADPLPSPEPPLFCHPCRTPHGQLAPIKGGRSRLHFSHQSTSLLSLTLLHPSISPSIAGEAPIARSPPPEPVPRRR
jgi:hypothetical protein